MNGDYPVNLAEMRRTIDRSEVISFYFPIIRRSLVVDTRCTAEDGPVVKIMPMVASPDDRSRAIKRLRPHLPKPEKLAVIQWPRYVRSMERLGITELVYKRLVSTGYPDSVRACERALTELSKYEFEELGQVIRGENYYTVWSRTPR